MSGVIDNTLFEVDDEKDPEETPDDVCMIPNCKKAARWRGLCQGCYGQAKKVMEDDKLEWEDLEEMGLCNLDKEKPFRKAYRLAKAARNGNTTKKQEKPNATEGSC